MQISTKAIVAVFIELWITGVWRAAILVNLSWTTRWEWVLWNTGDFKHTAPGEMIQFQDKNHFV